MKSKGLVLFSLVFVILAILIIVYLQAGWREFAEKEEELMPNEGIEIRGLDIQVHDRDGIKIAKEVGANWVGIMYFLEVDWDTGEIFEPEWGSREMVRERIREAKELGLKVLLQVYPEYYIEGAPPGYSHAVELQHGPFEDQEGFLENATKIVLEIARFAEEEGVDMFSPWCEMNIFVDWNHSKEWAREILPKVREVYSGLVAPPKGEITWSKYGLENEGDLSYWNFTGYDYVWADVFDSDYHTNGLHGSSKSYEDYRKYIRTLLGYLEELKNRSGAKGIILGSEVGLPEQFLAERVKEGEKIEEVVEKAWRILFEETYGKVDGYFFYPWRGEQHLATNLSFEANFSEFLKQFYFKIQPKVEWLRGIGFSRVDPREAKELGSNIVHIAVFPKILKNYSVVVLSDHSDLPVEEMFKMENVTKEEIRQQIREAHSQGLKVYLSIYPEFLHTHHGEIPWGEDRDRFLERMKEIAIDWARFAEEEGVEIYSPTTALYSLVGQENEEKWKDEVLREIRKVYSGEISSRAFEFYVWNKYSNRLIERKNVEFNFSGYDYIGLDIFGNDITDWETFREYVRKNLGKAVELMKKYGVKGITLGEIGFPHTEGTLRKIMNERNVSLEEAVGIARYMSWKIIIEEIKGKSYIIPFFSGVQANEVDIWFGERKWIKFKEEYIERTKELIRNFYTEKFEVDCDDFNPCTEDFFLGGECMHRKLSGDLEGCYKVVEGDACGRYSCVEGECAFVKEFSENCCDDGNPGTTDYYDEMTGKCIHEPRTCGLIIDEDFSNLEAWQVNEGSWKILDGVARAEGKSDLTLRGKKVDNFYLKIRARVLRGHFCISFREENGEEYLLSLVDITTSVIGLEKGGQRLASFEDNLDLREWFTLEIIAYEGRITVLFNGRKIIDVEDEKPFLSGNLHLGTGGAEPFSEDWEAKSEIDYIRVEKIC